MTTIKIQHADPADSSAVAFDSIDDTVKDDGAWQAWNDDPNRDPDKEPRNPIKETFVLESGHFKLLELSGGLHLREVSPAEIKARAERIAEQAEIEAEVAREQKAKADAEIAAKAQAERDERKARIEAGVAAQTGEKPADKRLPFTAPLPIDPLQGAGLGLNDPVTGAPPNSEENPPARHDGEHSDNARGIEASDAGLNSAGVKPEPVDGPRP